ncbi:hypothetical protein DESUT3_31550 [Desulfuromonas versatilis]|nr:hypothetical protein DESUT3_31550 [Desulfuromonas versatilis]
MPVPQQFARGDRMGRGPYEKSGIIEDTGLPPHKTVEERFDILFPSEDVTDENGRVRERKALTSDLDVKVELWYLPYGSKQSDPFLWREFSKTVSISQKGK